MDVMVSFSQQYFVVL